MWHALLAVVIRIFRHCFKMMQYDAEVKQTIQKIGAVLDLRAMNKLKGSNKRRFNSFSPVIFSAKVSVQDIVVVEWTLLFPAC